MVSDTLGLVESLHTKNHKKDPSIQLELPMPDNPFESPLTTAERQKQKPKVRRFLNLATFFGLLTPACWILLFTMMGIAWNDAVAGTSNVPWGMLVVTFWGAFGILQVVSIFIMYRAGSPFWLSITGVSFFAYCIITLAMLQS